MQKLYAILFIVLSGLTVEGYSTSLSIQSPAFVTNTKVPSQYTCNGIDTSPPLTWVDTTTTTKSYVLIVDDPDAPGGVWDHWVLFNIPPTSRQLVEGEDIPTSAISGKNSWGVTGYRGPCPPSGTHRYFFKLYALDILLTLNETASKQDVMNAMSNHIIATDELIGLYTK